MEWPPLVSQWQRNDAPTTRGEAYVSTQANAQQMRTSQPWLRKALRRPDMAVVVPIQAQGRHITGETLVIALSKRTTLDFQSAAHRVRMMDDPQAPMPRWGPAVQV